MNSRLWALLLVSLSCPALSYAAPDGLASVVFETKECEMRFGPLVEEMRSTLPKRLLEHNDTKFKISCSDRVFPYGFDVGRAGQTWHLRYGDFDWPVDPRATYRLAHLALVDRQLIWRKRAFVHLMVRALSIAQGWHKSAWFRQLNSWSRDGQVSHNKDSWAFSREQGMRSSLDDLVTFAEEWLVRPSQRPVYPDNRIECQSFSKGRFLRHQLAFLDVDLPSRECDSFYQWANQFSDIELLVTAPARAIESSFGHLAILLKRSNTSEPNFTDAVFQFVALVGTGDADEVLQRMYTEALPLVLYVTPYGRFMQDNTRIEDRHIDRFQLGLSPTERVWLMARLWEQLRRYEGVYHFTWRNCASELARVFAIMHRGTQAFESRSSTISPNGVFSRLIEAGLVQKRRNRVLSHSMRLKQLAGRLEGYRQSASTQTGQLPKVSRDVGVDAKVWSDFLRGVQELGPRAKVYVALAQDYYTELIWSVEVTPGVAVPTKPREFLKLKHKMFRVENTPERLQELLKGWFERVQVRYPKGRPELVQINAWKRLSDSLGNALGTLPSGLSKQSDEVSTERTIQSADGRWGSNGQLSYLLRFQGPALRQKQSSIEASIYSEAFANRRLPSIPALRDLDIFKVQLSYASDQTARVELTPLEMFLRRGVFGLSRLGAIVGATSGVWLADSARPYARYRLGPTLQLLRWSDGLGDISVATAMRHMIGAREHEPVGLFGDALLAMTVPLGPYLQFHGRSVWSQPFDHELAGSLRLNARLEWLLNIPFGRRTRVFLMGERIWFGPQRPARGLTGLFGIRFQ